MGKNKGRTVNLLMGESLELSVFSDMSSFSSFIYPDFNLTQNGH